MPAYCHQRAFTASMRPWASATQAMTGSDSTSWRDRRAASRASRSARIRAVMSWKALIACVGAPLGSSSGLARTIDQRSSPVAGMRKRTVTGGGCSPVSARRPGSAVRGSGVPSSASSSNRPTISPGAAAMSVAASGKPISSAAAAFAYTMRPSAAWTVIPSATASSTAPSPILERADADPRRQPLLDHVSWSPLA